MSYVPTTKKATNILTNGLTKPLFEKLIHKVRSITCLVQLEDESRKMIANF